MAAIILYGIPNCDTTKKALALLKKHKADFSFHDYKQQGITPAKAGGVERKKRLGKHT